MKIYALINTLNNTLDGWSDNLMVIRAMHDNKQRKTAFIEFNEHSHEDISVIMEFDVISKRDFVMNIMADSGIIKHDDTLTDLINRYVIFKQSLYSKLTIIVSNELYSIYTKNINRCLYDVRLGLNGILITILNTFTGILPMTIYNFLLYIVIQNDLQESTDIDSVALLYLITCKKCLFDSNTIDAVMYYFQLYKILPID